MYTLMVDWNNAVLAIHYEQLEYVTNDHIYSNAYNTI